MLGIRQFSAIIHPHQSCILTVGEPQKEFVSNWQEETVVEKIDDLLASIHHMMTITLSIDERVISVQLAIDMIIYC
jgi:pyruvate/2-oxoglutarate dehydrogenase complex dihydrolipoamide acyltransferase (E2) component